MRSMKDVSVPRLRQLKVANGTCELHPDVQQLTRICYSDYAVDAEEKEGFGTHGSTDGKRNATVRNITYTSESA